MPSDKMIFIAKIPITLLSFLGIQKQQIKIYRSKGLLSHLLKRKHYKAAKYLDFIPEIINCPDYAGFYDGQIELIKIFKDNIFLSIKLWMNQKVCTMLLRYLMQVWQRLKLIAN